jgi:threonine/homoserine/homoserine lactone efflux protein
LVLGAFPKLVNPKFITLIFSKDWFWFGSVVPLFLQNQDSILIWVFFILGVVLVLEPLVKLGPSQFLALEPTVPASNFLKIQKNHLNLTF